jgi:hypothetical protein
MTRYNNINASSSFFKLILTLVVAMFMSGSDTGSTHGVSAFLTTQGRWQQIPTIVKTKSYTSAETIKHSATVLHERQWNFNEGQGPFGLKKNAETWNGRVAQVCLSSITNYSHVYLVETHMCILSY